jgi:membrane protein implicated in regulation of membrane protease activity
MMQDLAIGLPIVIAGVVLLAFDLVHPGALLLIPGSVLLVGGLLFIADPAIFFSPQGAFVVVGAALLAALLEIPWYRYWAPIHAPMTSTSGGMAGEVGVVTVAVVPDSLKGKVRVRSQIWSARSDRAIPAGSTVRVVSGEGVSLAVEPLDPNETAPVP